MEGQAHFERAAALHKEGRVDEALGEFDAALRLDPRHAGSHYYRAYLLEAKARYAEAAAAFEAFLACAGPKELTVADAVKARIAALRQAGGAGTVSLREQGTLSLREPQGTLSLRDEPGTLSMKEPQGTLSMPEAAAGAPAAAGAAWEPGQVVDGLYQVREVLGEGGFGTVHRVWHRGWGLEMAVKSLRADRVGSRRDLESFVQEANTWVGLGLHPHIVACYFVRVLGVPRIFVEFLEGGSLADWLDQGRVKDLPAALDLALQAARAMRYAHSKGLVHRDLKPANCLVTPGGVVKVTDFGLAVTAGASGGAAGTPEYMAPEQWAGSAQAAVDVWAFGVMLFELCLGRRPFRMERGEPAQAFRARMTAAGWAGPDLGTLPARLRGLIAACLSVDPRGRPADFTAVAAALEWAYAEAAGRPARLAEAEDPPLLAGTLVNQGVSMADLGRTEEAQRLFAEALRLDPTHPGALHNQGLLRAAHSDTTAFVLVPPRGAEAARMTGVAFRALLSRAREEADAGRYREAYATARKALGVQGYEHAAEALDLIRLLSRRGRATALRSAWPEEGASASAAPPASEVRSPDGRFILAVLESGRVSVRSIPDGEPAGSFGGPAGSIESVAVPEAFVAVTAGPGGTRRWTLDWELEFPDARPWDEAAAPVVEAFLARRGAHGPLSDAEFRSLWGELERRGLGWLDPGGVRARASAAKEGTQAAPGRSRWAWRLAGAVLLAAGLGRHFLQRPQAQPEELEPVPFEAAPKERPRPQTPPEKEKLSSVTPRPLPKPEAPQDACEADVEAMKLTRIVEWKDSKGAATYRAMVDGKLLTPGGEAGRRSRVWAVRQEEVEFECPAGGGLIFTKRL